MAVVTTPKWGLRTYTAGSDAHPTRVEFNEMITAIESKGVTGSKGLASARPSAGLESRFYWATDQSRIYWDDGSQWWEISTNGGGGAGAPVTVAGTAIEGVSGRSARADHTHNLPLATTSVDGAMAATDKLKLNNAVAAANASALVLRDASGRAKFADPSAAADAATKGYVDALIGGTSGAGHTHDASDVLTGILDPARLPDATSGAKGAISAADKTKLDNAVSTATASRLVIRDASGRAQFATPSASGDAATKGYVDGALSAQTHADATTSVAGFMPAADKTKLDNAVSAATASRLVIRDGSGRAQFATPSASGDAATKGYVDGLMGGLADATPPIGHMGITSGTPSVNNTSYVRMGMSSAQIAANGVTFNDANDALVVPTTGYYRVYIRGMMEGSSSSGDVIFRARAYIAGSDSGIGVDLTVHGYLDDQQYISSGAEGIRLINAGEFVQLYQRSNPSAGTTSYGTNGYNGAYVGLQWICGP